jgi:hypothetical protein
MKKNLHLFESIISFIKLNKAPGSPRVILQGGTRLWEGDSAGTSVQGP